MDIATPSRVATPQERSADRRSRFETIVHGASELVVVTDAGGVIGEVSDRAARALGYEPAALLGRSVFALLHPDEADDALRSFATTITAPGPNVPLELRVRDAAGLWRPFEVVATNMLDVPAVHALVFHCRDVRERHDQQRRFRLLFEQSPVAQVLLYPDRAGLIVNAAFTDLLGRDREDLLLAELRDLVDLDDRDGYDDDVGGLLDGSREYFVSVRRYVRADGSVFCGRTHLGSVRNDAGRLEYLLGTVEDVTDHVEANRLLAVSEARFRALVNNSPDIVAILYPDGEWEASDEGTRQLGYPKGHEPDGGVFSLIHPDDVARAGQAFAEILDRTRSPRQPIELRLRAADGTYWDFECVGQNLGDDPAVGGVVVTARNVTARKQVERALREAQARFRAAFEHAPMTVSVIDLDRRILDINPAGCALLGRTRAQLIGSDAQATIHPDDVQRALEATVQQLSDGEGHAEFRLRRADGSDVWVLSTAALVEPDDETAPYVITLQTDISVRKQLEERLAREAATDPLTGLLNRAAFLTHLDLLLAQRHAPSLALLFIDLDHFKAVNDTAGHEAGDTVLSTIAARLTQSTRVGDLVARLGGDEFVVLCHDVDDYAAHATAQRIITATRAPIMIDGRTHHVGASLGLAIIEPHEDAASVLRRADAAAYRAKRNGGSAVHVADPTSRASQTPTRSPQAD